MIGRKSCSWQPSRLHSLDVLTTSISVELREDEAVIVWGCVVAEAEVGAIAAKEARDPGRRRRAHRKEGVCEKDKRSIVCLL